MFVGRVCIVFPNDARNPCSLFYAGPWPASELETQAVTSFVLERNESIKAFVSLHSFFQLIMTRWGYTADLYPPDHSEIVRRVLLSVGRVTTLTMGLYRQF